MTSEEAQRILPYCKTECQTRAVQAVIDGENMDHASILYGSGLRALRQQLQDAKAQASYKGHAPNHFDSGVAEGYKISKATIQRDSQGNIERTWERQTPDDIRNENLIEAIENSASNFKKKALNKIRPPKKVNDELLTLYTITDFHIGMLADPEECGEAWDIKIAERVLINAIDDMVTGSPEAEEAILCNLGDFIHFDGLDSVTPASKHPLDADSRFHKLVDLSIRMIQYCTARLLEKHKRVKLIMCEGNHDESSSVWLRKCMKYLFANNDRVEVDDMAFPYYAHLHGEILLGFHHGHKMKHANMAKLFSSEPRFRQMWGNAKYTFVHTGHFHHQKVTEDAGCITEQHPTLAGKDAYSSRGGYVSWRCAKAITYHKTTGEYSRKVVHPDYNER